MRLWVAVAVCAFVGQAANGQRIELRDGTKPPPGEIATASVGSSIFEKFRYGMTEAYEIEDEIDRKIVLNKVRIPAGAKMIPIGTSKALKACYVFSQAEIGGEYDRGCTIDDDGDGTFDRVAGNPMQGAVTLNPKVAYHRADIRMSKVGDDFRQMFTFLGVSAGTLRLGYREFVNDMARPAFSEEFTFPLDGKYPATIAVKELKFVILGIDGAGMRYKIEPPMGN